MFIKILWFHLICKKYLIAPLHTLWNEGLLPIGPVDTLLPCNGTFFSPLPWRPWWWTPWWTLWWTPPPWRSPTWRPCRPCRGGAMSPTLGFPKSLLDQMNRKIEVDHCTMRRSPLKSVNWTIYQNMYLAPHFFPAPLFQMTNIWRKYLITFTFIVYLATWVMNNHSHNKIQ